MNLPQPEPLKNVAVTREAIEKRLESGLSWSPGLVSSVIGSILTERDEALREVERLKDEASKRPSVHEEALVFKNIANENATLKKSLSAEKRRTAAYREVARRKHGNWSLKIVDAEAQKLLAPSDSGGEKVS